MSFFKVACWFLWDKAYGGEILRFVSLAQNDEGLKGGCAVDTSQMDFSS